MPITFRSPTCSPTGRTRLRGLAKAAAISGARRSLSCHRRPRSPNCGRSCNARDAKAPTSKSCRGGRTPSRSIIEPPAVNARQAPKRKTPPPYIRAGALVHARRAGGAARTAINLGLSGRRRKGLADPTARSDLSTQLMASLSMFCESRFFESFRSTPTAARNTSASRSLGQLSAFKAIADMSRRLRISPVMAAYDPTRPSAGISSCRSKRRSGRFMACVPNRQNS